jgi:hypothetical protein
MVISHDKATMAELDTVYSIEDVYDMIEIILVDNYNEHLSRDD